MHITNLRKVGDSVMRAVPPALLEQLQLQADAQVGLTIDAGHLLIKPVSRPRYTMAGLLANSDYSQPQPPEAREWMDAPAAGWKVCRHSFWMKCGQKSAPSFSDCG